MEKPVHILLNEILYERDRLGFPVGGLLLDALSHRQVTGLLSQLPYEPPTALIDIYTWRNGTIINASKKLGELSLFPGFYLMSLEEAKQRYEALTGVQHLKPEWFPIFANGAGDFYCIDIGNDRTRGQIIGFIKDLDEQPIEFGSLESMLDAILDCFRQRAYYVGEDGYLDSHLDQEKQINEKYRRGVGSGREQNR